MPGLLSASDPPTQEMAEFSENTEISENTVNKKPASASRLSGTEHEAALGQLRGADEAFNRALGARDRTATETLIAADATFLEEQDPSVGKSAFLKLLEPAFDGRHGFTFAGETLEVQVARSGELGYTIGQSTITFKQPWEDEPTVGISHYLTVWTREAGQPWRILVYSTLVVHPELGQATDPRTAIMKAIALTQPELADQATASVRLEWTPKNKIQAASGEMLYTYSKYQVSFTRGEEEMAGGGDVAAIWLKDEKDLWTLRGEAYTPTKLISGD